jgi:polyisoprenyl-teichoic acid--peptidoglycan teichoic acid transferase
MKRAILALGVLVSALLVASALHAPARPARAEPVAFTLQRVKGSYAPPPSGRTPFTILAIGNDYRPGETPCGCADSLHLITVNPQEQAATILGFPRDSWVPIPGHGTNRINTSLKSGGPELVVATVEQLTGLDIDYYLLADFEGFSRAVDGIGGIFVDVPYAMHDPYSGADFEAGRVHMMGGDALAFSRNRHGAPGGDLGRSENQGRVFLGALEKLRRDFRLDPALLVSWIAVGSRHLASDLSLGELTRVTIAASRIDPERVTNLVVPATIGTVGSASVVFITEAAQGIYADLRDDGILGV